MCGRACEDQDIATRPGGRILATSLVRLLAEGRRQPDYFDCILSACHSVPRRALDRVPGGRLPSGAVALVTDADII